jgi:hypothetical protein
VYPQVLEHASYQIDHEGFGEEVMGYGKSTCLYLCCGQSLKGRLPEGVQLSAVVLDLGRRVVEELLELEVASSLVVERYLPEKRNWISPFLVAFPASGYGVSPR